MPVPEWLAGQMRGRADRRAKSNGPRFLPGLGWVEPRRDSQSGFGEGRPFFTTESHGGPRRKELDRGLSDAFGQTTRRVMPSLSLRRTKLPRGSHRSVSRGATSIAQKSKRRRESRNVLSVRRFFATMLRPLRLNFFSVVLRGAPWLNPHVDCEGFQEFPPTHTTS